MTIYCTICDKVFKAAEKDANAAAVAHAQKYHKDEASVLQVSRPK